MTFGEIHRPANPFHPSRRDPSFGFGEQRCSDLLIVNALEETEESDGLVMKLHVPAVHNSGNAPDDFLTVPSEKVLNFGVLVERVFAWVEEFLQVEE
jgi:hypothetical protein